MNAPTPATLAPQGAPPAHPRRPGLLPYLLRRLVILCRPLLRPHEAFFGPIFQREVRVLARRRTTYTGRLVFLLALTAMVAMVYAAATSSAAFANGSQQLQQFQNLAPTVARTLAWFQFIAVIFITANLTGPSINQERTKGTLSALVTSPLAPLSIVLSTLTSRIAQILVIIASTTPLLLAVRAFGGLEVRTILAVTALTMSSATLSGSLGVLGSVLIKKASASGGFAVGVMIAICIHPLVIAAVMAFLGLGAPPGWVFVTSPIVAMLSLPEVGGVLPFGSIMWPYTVAIDLLIAFGTCVLAASMFGVMTRADAVSDSTKPARKKKGAPTFPPADPVAPAADAGPGQATTIAVARSSRPTHAVDSSRTVGDNPVMWRELRAPAFKKKAMLIICSAIAVIIFAWAYIEGGLQSESFQMSVAIILVLSCLGQGAPAASGAITGEVEARTLPVLLTTPLAPRTILWAKMLGSLRRQWFLPGILVTHLVISVIAGGVSIAALYLIPVVLVSTLFFLCCTSVLFSLLARKTSTASVLNMLLAVGLWVGVPMVVAMLMAALNIGSSNNGDTFALGLTMMINPVALAGVSMFGTILHDWHDGSARPFELPGFGHMGLAEWMMVVTIASAVAIGAGIGALALASLLWKRCTVRRL